jgi:hypothetical protein
LHLICIVRSYLGGKRRGSRGIIEEWRGLSKRGRGRGGFGKEGRGKR